MKLAAIDLGSNSIHMIIVEVAPDGSFRVMDREKDMVGLGRGTLELNYLDERAMGLGLETLRKFAKLAERHGCEEVLAVATSATREALNGGDFIERVRRETGIQVNVITAVEEARLIALAVREGIDLADQRALVIDIGGGSVEMILVEKGKVAAADSFKLGVIRLAERFLGEGTQLDRGMRKALVETVRTVTGDFVALARRRGFDVVVGTSGTVLALGALAAGVRTDGGADAPSLNGRAVPLEALKAQAARLQEMGARDRARLPGVDERRADTILVGAVLLVDVLERMGAAELVLCDRALREGIVVDFLERNRERLGRMGAIPSLRARSVLELAERCGHDPAHSAQVARFALQIFDRTRAFHGLGPEPRALLEHAAALHDIGTHIAYPGHHRHGYYLVKYGGLRGFRAEEVDLLAGIVLYHRKRAPRRDDPGVRGLGKEGRRALRVLAGILRVADGLDRTHFQVVQDLSFRIAGDVVTIYVDGREDPELEVWAANRKGRLLERAIGVTLRVVLKGPRLPSGAAARGAPGPAAPAAEAG